MDVKIARFDELFAKIENFAFSVDPDGGKTTESNILSTVFVCRSPGNKADRFKVYLSGSIGIGNKRNQTHARV